MKKTSVFLTMLIVIAMLTSSFVTLINNVTFAVMENITVVFTADSDSKLELSEDGKTLTYTCEDNTKFSIGLQESKTTDLVLRKETTEIEPGHYSDSYIIENISSNENVYIKCENIDLSKLSIMHDGVSIGMLDGYSLSLNQIDDANHYQFRIEELMQNSGDEPGDDQNLGEVFMVDFGSAEWTVDGTKVTAAVWGMTINEGPVEIDGKELIKLDGFDSETMQIVVRASDGFTSYLQIVTDNNETRIDSADASGFPEGQLTFTVEKKNDSSIEPDNEPANVGSGEDIQFDVQFTNTHMNVWINSEVVMSDEKELMDKFEGTIAKCGTTNPSETNTLKFVVAYGDKAVSEFIINGITYKNDGNKNVEVSGEYWFITVPGASKYTISGVADENSTAQRTIIWTNPGYVPTDEEDAEWIKEFKLEHGSAYVKAVYDKDGRAVDLKENLEGWDESEIDRGVRANKFGHVTITPGSKVVFELVPEYGYQLTNIQINGQSLGIGDKINEFEFVMPDANIHFDAEFTKTEDVVKANSKNVSSGTVSLAENSIDAGTVQLTVNDIELDAEKIKGFEEAAGDYKISNYLDINLYQVFYKGKKDSEDVWLNKISELENEATISIKLKDGITADDTVIVHNVHDGDEYEVIKIDSYDENTNTITFKTSSFSNYAIATKAGAEEKYTIETEDYVLTFTDEAGHEFTAQIVELWGLTDEEIATLGIPSEEYENTKKTIGNNVKKYGTVLSLYDIKVTDDEHVRSEGVTFKIKMTDEMKKFNSFKLVNLDENDFSAKDVVELKVEGDYLVGALPHLSVYALVGENVESQNSSGNPTTGDNITIFIVLFALAILGIFATIKFSKTHKARKH